MKYARNFSIIVFTALGLYGAIGFYFLPLAAFEGDQTRMGLLPEVMFGWRKPQPAVDPALLQQSAWRDADVLVIGDSFSEKRIWQTELVRHGLRVRTEHWTHVRSICEDFMPWLRSQGFRGRYLVVESVERNIKAGFAEDVGCNKMHPHLNVSADRPVAAPPTFIDRDLPEYSGRLSIGLETRRNMVEYERLSAAPGFRRWDTGRGSIVARVADGCELFSHRRCSDAIFLSWDNTQDLGDDVVKNMQILDKRLTGLNTLWVIVPDKTTAYLHPDKRFWDIAAAGVHSVDMLKIVREAIGAKTKDVYPANNSHFSTESYLTMGKAIYRALQETPAGK